MSLVTSAMLELGTSAPDFHLPDTNGELVSRDDFREQPALLVIFMCNHCPYVQHVRDELADIGREYQPEGVAIVGINPNDPARYPEDSWAHMRETAAEVGYTFPYLQDEHQAVAIAYKATCTPDFFLFDRERKLVYRGQLDDSRPGNKIPVTGEDLRAALDAVLEDQPIVAHQKPSAGCSIKWKPGHEPGYFQAMLG